MDSHKNEEPAVVATIVTQDELAYRNGHVAGRLTAEERELNRRIEFVRQERERDRLVAARRPICAPVCCPCCWPCYLPCLCCCLPNLCI